jgi:hypothetical protein
MIKGIISMVLLLISAALSFKHGWDTFNYKNNSESINMMNELGISQSYIPALGTLAIVTGVLVLLPRTFFLGNLLNAFSILLVMSLALRAGNYKLALIEIPFLALPLLLIGLKYPFNN